MAINWNKAPSGAERYNEVFGPWLKKVGSRQVFFYNGYEWVKCKDQAHGLKMWASALPRPNPFGYILHDFGGENINKNGDIESLEYRKFIYPDYRELILRNHGGKITKQDETVWVDFKYDSVALDLWSKASQISFVNNFSGE